MGWNPIKDIKNFGSFVDRNRRSVRDKTKQALKFNLHLGSVPKQRGIAQRPSVATPETLSQQAQSAGQLELTRHTRRRGRRGTIFAGRRDLAPARTSAAELRQTL